MFTFSIIAGASSIFGALVAFLQAKKARTAAQEAKRVEWNIKHQRSTSDIARLKEKAGYLVAQVSVYGHGVPDDKYQSVDHSKNAELIQQFFLKLQEYQGCLSEKLKKEIEVLVGDIDMELSNFHHALTDASRKESGRKILTKVNMINSRLRYALVSNIEDGGSGG